MILCIRFRFFVSQEWFFVARSPGGFVPLFAVGPAGGHPPNLRYSLHLVIRREATLTAASRSTAALALCTWFETRFDRWRPHRVRRLSPPRFMDGQIFWSFPPSMIFIAGPWGSLRPMASWILSHISEKKKRQNVSFCLFCFGLFYSMVVSPFRCIGAPPGEAKNPVGCSPGP